MDFKGNINNQGNKEDRILLSEEGDYCYPCSKATYSILEFGSVAPNLKQGMIISTITDETIKKEYSTAADDTRRLAAELKGYIELVPLIHPGIPNRTNLEEASSYLIGLSNGFYQLPEGSEDKSAHYNNQRIEKIKKLLKLYNHH